MEPLYQSLSLPTQEDTPIVMNINKISKPNGKIKRSVKFATNENFCEIVAILKPRSAMTKVERNLAWYDSSELEQFKSKVRSVIKLRRSSIDMFRQRCGTRRNSKTNFNTFDKLSIPKLFLEDASCDRGLEFRLSIERQRNKYLAIRSVLEAQQELRNMVANEMAIGRDVSDVDFDHRLALISNKYSRSAKEHAIRIGQLDFACAHPDVYSLSSCAINPTFLNFMNMSNFELTLLIRTGITNVEHQNCKKKPRLI